MTRQQAPDLEALTVRFFDALDRRDYATCVGLLAPDVAQVADLVLRVEMGRPPDLLAHGMYQMVPHSVQAQKTISRPVRTSPKPS